MFFRPGTTRLPFRTNDRARKTGRRLQRIELDPATDAHARAAIEAYADSCALEMPWLAELLRASAAREHGEITHCAATTMRVFVLAQEWAAGQPDYAHAAWEHVRTHLDAALRARLQADMDAGVDEIDAGEVIAPAGADSEAQPLVADTDPERPADPSTSRD